MNSKLVKILNIMKKENLPENVINTFKKYYEMVEVGKTGFLDKTMIKPPSKSKIIQYDELKESQKNYFHKLAIIKLNGGLGTSMGLKKAKSLLPVKGDINFLDVIVNQVLKLRKDFGADIPLILMNSFNTSKDTLDYLQKYPTLKLNNFPLDFLQHKFPKLKQQDLSFLNDEDDKANWNPPGHGDIYLSMYNSGILDELLDKGIEYLFISNSDNLGATIDEKILSYFAENNIPFMMEVCNRTEADKKGGHLAEDKDGKLILREVAQCPTDEINDFQNIELFQFFNTNNIWLNLKSLKKHFIANNNEILLPLILNSKVVNNVPVYQIESAMGSAINIFEGAKAIVVPRNRFAPVKKTNDLLVIWSDAYILDDSYRIVQNPECEKIPLVMLDSQFYGTIEQLKDHFKSIPSLKKCKYLEVKGEIYFDGENIFEEFVRLDVDETSWLIDNALE